MKKQPYHKRLRDWESFDRITFEVVPRYKTSGLSGDEWRQHVEVKFWHKGEVVHSVGYRDMEAAFMLASGEFIRAQEPIPDRVIEIDKTMCDQPSCTMTAVARFRIKEEFGDRGERLHSDDARSLYHDAYRQFCKRHLRRGDCGREDNDENYEPMDGIGPDASTNLEEGPSVLAPPVFVESAEDLRDAIESLRKSRP